MHPITLDYEKSFAYTKNGDLAAYAGAIKRCHDMLHQGTGPSCDYLGWLDLPDKFDREEIMRIKAEAEKIRISGYLLGANPFDQPGVEAYKREMRGLLGK